MQDKHRLKWIGFSCAAAWNNKQPALAATVGGVRFSTLNGSFEKWDFLQIVFDQIPIPKCNWNNEQIALGSSLSGSVSE